MNKDKINQLLKYLIREIDQQVHQKKGSEKEKEIIFMKKNDLTKIDIEENSTRNEEDIFISNDMIYIMYENGTLISQEFENELSQFPYIYFDIQYPTSTFEQIYSEIIKLKGKLGNRIKLSIFHTGQENIDQRFHKNKEINNLVLDKTVKNIKSSGLDGSFEGCSSLMSVSIPSSVTFIESSAFYGCSSLTSVSIPSSLNINSVGFNEKVKITKI